MEVKKGKNRIIIAFLALCVTVLSCMVVFAFHYGNDTVTVKATERANSQTCTFNNIADFIEYSHEYAAGNCNRADDLVISLTSGIELNLDGFISIGTASAPFEGSLTINGSNQLRLYNCPLFDYVSTDMTISGVTPDIYRDYAESAQNPTGAAVLTSGALFANHVVAGSGAANWSMTLSTLNGGASSYSGVFGEIGDDAVVTVNYTNNSNLNVSGPDDLGLIAGTLGEGATLNVTLAGTSSGRTLTSSGGNAGGLVGKMKAGSTLNVTTGNLSGLSTITAQASNKYAGGVVGYNDGGIVNVTGANYDVSSTTVSGTSGAGGLFGYYKNTGVKTFSKSKYVVNGTKISATGSTPSYAGGIFGLLENSSEFTINGTVENAVVNSGSSRSGVIGGYTANALTNTLNVSNVSAKITTKTSLNTGGIIGSITNNPAYVSFSGILSEIVESATQSTNANVSPSSNFATGGLVGVSGTGGSFIDVTGDVKIKGKYNAGLVGNMQSGVLRLDGVTDISELSFDENKAKVRGQLVYKRGRSLIYSNGSGNYDSTGWKLIRNTAFDRGTNDYASALHHDIDDINGWGQVIRLNGTDLSESNLFTVDSTNHTVEVKAANTTISNITGFALMALNMQLNSGNTGALKFAAGSNSSTLLGSGTTITLNADIDLSGTGFSGFTGDDAGGAGIEFKGKLNGNNHKITLSTGETYGCRWDNSNVVALPSTSKLGCIVKHEFVGLFAKLGTGAKIYDFTLDGNVMFSQGNGSRKVGGLASVASGMVTLENVTVNHELVYRINWTFDSIYIGGAIAYADGSLNLNVTDCTISPTFTEYVLTFEETAHTYVGGLIGYMEGTNTQIVNVEDTTFSPSLVRDKNAAISVNIEEIYFGGVIGYTYLLDSASYSIGRRAVSLTDVDIDGATASEVIASTADSIVFGVLGAYWLATDVTIDGLTIDNTEFTLLSASNVGALVQTATGHWDIRTITVAEDGLTLNLPSSCASFGFVANKGYNGGKTTALYLDVDNGNNGDNYDISKLDLGSSSFTVYDELVAYSILSGSVSSNGQAIISVSTTDGNGLTASNAYANKTSLGSGRVNPNTRYYYNLKAIRTKASKTGADLLQIWSTGVYAHSSISSWFNAGTTEFTGSLDMTEYSYYPVDYAGSLTLSNATLKFDNNAVENIQGRTTRSNTNQHYLMQTGLLLNYTGSFEIDELTVQGNIPIINQTSGFLVMNTMGGDNVNETTFTASGITLSGAFVTSAGSKLTGNTYAPLLINGVGSYSTLSIVYGEQDIGIQQEGYTSVLSSSQYAASSLIGNVGTEHAVYIDLLFSGISLDSRSGNINISDLNTRYGSTKAIFSRATLLNSFQYQANCTATYNFTRSEDWEGNTSTAVHDVTYGYELTTSAKYSDYERNKYYPISKSDARKYINPTANNNVEYDFSSNYLKYVYDSTSTADRYEIAVNISLDMDIEGTGKNGDPYIINDGNKLSAIAKIINGQAVSTTITIQLPVSMSSYSGTTSDTRYTYQYGESSFTSTDEGDPVATDDVMKYLAGAYYDITDDIDLKTDYIGLGKSGGSFASEFRCPYAFRGVIVGDEIYDEELADYRNPVITNKSNAPLVYSSNGCVIKDVIVKVDCGITLAVPAANSSAQQFLYTGGMDAYGGLIGRVMGGDNIIDGALVTFSGNFAVSFSENNYRQRLVPIGGYAGVVVNGGLVFRNMSGIDSGNNPAGLTNSKLNLIGNGGYLFANPFIGRVIAGYSFNEGADYHYTESTSLLKNGSKNYSIPDLVVPNDAAKKISVFNSTKIITVPDGQAMHILSLIVNSGAASASSEAFSQDETTPWSGFRQYTVTRSGNDSTALPESAYDSTSKVPYIIGAFTTKDGSIYRAKGMCTTNAYSVSLVQSGTYNLPEAYRGIGSIYYNNTKYRLRFITFDGQNVTVTNNMKFVEYDHVNALSYKAASCIVNATGETTAGLGLFNQIKQQIPNDPADMENYVIKDFVLAGSIYYDVYNMSTGSLSTYNNGSTANNVKNDNGRNANNTYTYLTVGGFAGYANGRFYIKNVTFGGLSIESANGAGGIIGHAYGVYNTESKVSFTTDSAGSVTITANTFGGGVVGRTDLATVTIEGKETGTEIRPNANSKSEVFSDSGDNGYAANIHTGIGGVIGTINGYGYSSQYGPVTPEIGTFSWKMRKIAVSNLIVSSPSGSAYSIGYRNVDHGELNYAGGVIGSFQRVYVDISNVKVQNINISANYAGGIIGYATQRYFLKITDVTLDGNEKNYSITGARFAGGVVGKMYLHDEGMISFNNISVTGYNVVSSATATASGSAGGVIGAVENDETEAKNNPLLINDFVLRDCSIVTKYSANNATDCGSGSVFGSTFGGRASKIYGYNYLLDDNTIQHFNNGGVSPSTNRKMGEVGGNNANNSIIRIVGVSLQKTSPLNKIVGYYSNDTNRFGTNGYVVFSDYNGTLLTTPNVNNYSAIDGTYSEVNEPYATVNPLLELPGLSLTGDGVAGAADTSAPGSYNGLVLNEIMYSILSNSGGKYTYSATNANLTILENNKRNYSMFSTLAGASYSGTDFVVLAPENMTMSQLQDFVNTNIRVLTNTTLDYNADLSEAFELSIYKVVFENGSFVVYPDGTSSLKRGDSGFYSNRNDFDSGKGQFSLIDVKFFNPFDTGEVAFHFYLPVVVKKVISYDFNVAASSGTTYLPANGMEFGNALMENTGSAITLYMEYVYGKEDDDAFRTEADWIDALNNGENAERYYAKYLSFRSVNAELPNLPDDTFLVLVDPNNGGKSYYAYYEDAFTNGLLDFTKFKTTLDEYGVPFEPVKLDEIFGITVEVYAEGTLASCDAANATIVDKEGNYYCSATGKEETLYAITNLDNFVESYYLTIFTDSATADETLYHYSVAPQPDLASTVPMARIKDSDAKNSSIHLFLGNIFIQDAESISLSTRSLNGSEIISVANNQIDAEIEVTFGLDTDHLNAENLREIKSYLNGIELYQGFVIYLTRTENGVIEKIISGNPIATGNYSIESDEYDYSSDGIVNTTAYYIEFITGNLSSYFISDTSCTLSSNISIAYNAADIPLQFPGRNTEIETNDGVSVSAESHISFTASNTVRSRNIVSQEDATNSIYYSIGEKDNAELYLGVVGAREGDYNPLGVNPKTLEENAISYEFTLAAALDITGIYSLVSDYESATVTVTLQQKANNGSYGEDLNIPTYINSINGDTELSGTSYSFTVNKTSSASTVLLPNMTFNIKTGSDFERSNLSYANYRITVSVILNKNGNPMGSSAASNFVIYTHAKVLPDFIS